MKNYYGIEITKKMEDALKKYNKGQEMSYKRCGVHDIITYLPEQNIIQVEIMDDFGLPACATIKLN